MWIHFDPDSFILTCSFRRWHEDVVGIDEVLADLAFDVGHSTFDGSWGSANGDSCRRCYEPQ